MRILLVEDEIRLARSYQRNLRDEGHQVEILGDGEAAYARVCQDPGSLDVLVLDVLLPGQNGFAVCRAIRREGVTIPILMLTALDQTRDKVAGLDAGADDYLTKPFPIEELLARLRAIVRRGNQRDTAAQLRIGDLTIDLLRREVSRGKQIIALTAQIWPDGTEARSNVLDTYIHYLRDKLDRGAHERLIHTIRGVGYMLRSSGGGALP